MNIEELGKRIYEISKIEGNFVLRSGQSANEYFDKYLFEADPTILSTVAQQMADILPSIYDKLAGLEMGESHLRQLCL